MNYHWEWASADRVVFVADDGCIAAFVQRSWTGLGAPNARFNVTGPLMARAQDFNTLEEGMIAVEGIAGCRWPHSKLTDRSDFPFKHEGLPEWLGGVGD